MEGRAPGGQHSAGGVLAGPIPWARATRAATGAQHLCAYNKMQLGLFRPPPSAFTSTCMPAASTIMCSLQRRQGRQGGQGRPQQPRGRWWRPQTMATTLAGGGSPCRVATAAVAALRTPGSGCACNLAPHRHLARGRGLCRETLPSANVGAKHRRMRTTTSWKRPWASRCSRTARAWAGS